MCSISKPNRINNWTKKPTSLRSVLIEGFLTIQIIWCGIWTKKLIQNPQLLSETLVSYTLTFLIFLITHLRLLLYINFLHFVQLQTMISKTSNMATLLDLSFFEAYGGESMDGSCVAKFTSKSIISMISIAAKCGDINDLSYACLAIFKSRFRKIEGVNSGICLKSQNRPTVVSLHVWNSPFYCYSWILNSDHLNSMLPYLDHFSLCIKYDIYQVVNISDANVPNFKDLDNDEERGNKCKSFDVK